MAGSNRHSTKAPPVSVHRWLKIGLALTGLVFCVAASRAETPVVTRIPLYSEVYPQFFDLDQGPDRRLHVGGDGWLISFDGQRWQRTAALRPGPLRALLRDRHGRLWVGGNGWFGYLATDADGVDQLVDISEQFGSDLGDETFADIWEIVEGDQGILFRALHSAFLVDGEGQRQGYFQHAGRFGAALALNGQILIQRRGDGLFRIEDGQLRRYGDDPIFRDSMLTAAFALDAERFVAIDRRPGLSLVERGRRRDLAWPGDPAALGRLHTGVRLPDGDLAFAGDDGILRGYHMASATVTELIGDGSFQAALRFDQDGALLILSDLAITRLYWPPSLVRFSPDDGIRGGIHGVTLTEHAVYAAGFGGVLVARRSGHGDIHQFVRLPGEILDSWAVLPDGDELLIAEGHSLWQRHAEKRLAIGGTDLYPRVLLKSRFAPDRLLIGTELGLAVAARVGRDWRLLAQHHGLRLRANALVELAAGDLLLSSGDRGLWRIHLDLDSGELRGQSQIGPGQGLPTDVHPEVLLFERSHAVCLSTSRGFFEWRDDRLVPLDIGGLAALKQPNEALRIQADGQGGLFAIGGHAVYHDRGQGQWHEIALEAGDGSAVNAIAPLGDGGGLVATSSGLLRYRASAIQQPAARAELKIARLTLDGGDNAVRTLPLAGPLSIEHSDGVLHIELSLTDYDPGPAPQFQVRLKGLEANWSRPSALSSFRYAQLPVGEFEIEARAERGPGRAYALSPLKLAVLPHWYQQTWARLAALLPLLLAFGAGLQWRHRRHVRVLAARNRALDAQVAARTRELASANRRLRDLAEHDGLTGVANRRQFDLRLQELLADPAACFPLALLLLDVDFFKQFNDRFGHLAGDEALRRVAAALVVNTRPGDLVARYGGEEFAVLAPRCTESAAAELGERLCRAVAASDAGVTISIGIDLHTQPGQTPTVETLIAGADRALYQAKAEGRNRVVRAT